MARVISRGAERKQVARFLHAECGSLVEFEPGDVRSDREGGYVECPACNKPPWIAATLLTWTDAPTEDTTKR